MPVGQTRSKTTTTKEAERATAERSKVQNIDNPQTKLKWFSDGMIDCGERGRGQLAYVYHDSHCDVQPWARAAHPSCSA